jgi:SAM-dependent methyltransferase
MSSDSFADELNANPLAAVRIVLDLNANPRLPFDDVGLDAAVCCVSVDYLTQPIELFAEVARVLCPGGPLVCTFSNQ